MLRADQSATEPLFLGDARHNQPCRQPEQNDQCEEGKLPRTGSEDSWQRYGLKLRVTLTVASPPVGCGKASFSE